MCILCQLSNSRDYRHHLDHLNDGDAPAHDHDGNSAIDNLSLGAVQATNTTGKPNFGWDEAADIISRDDRKWDGGQLGTPGTVTYSFLSNAQADSGYYQLSAAQIAGAEAAMELWSQVANISFEWADANNSRTYSDAGEIDFQAYDGGNGGWASYGWYTGGPTKELYTAKVALGGDDFSLALHEIGHAIALSHPGDYNGGGNTYARDAEFFEDTEQFSVMSYWNGSNSGADLFEWRQDDSGQWQAIGGATGLGLYDIAAIQRVYGANNSTYSGNTTYGFNSNTGDDGWSLTGEFDWIQAAIWDTGGTDTIDASGYSESSEIDLRQLAFSSLGALTNNLAIAEGVVIENAVGGTGADLLIGNSANNMLSGRSGNDTLRGGNGDDVLRGDWGADNLNGGDGDDWASYTRSKSAVTIDLGAGTASGGHAEGDSFTSIEKILGSRYNDMITGDGAANYLRGNKGNDILNGGGGNDILRGDQGADELNGGSGYDRAYYSSSNAAVTINLETNIASGGHAEGDTFSSIERILGSRFNDTITGDASGNYLRGNNGNDTLGGGRGNDTLRGDQGADIFEFKANGGTDRVLDFQDGIDLLRIFGNTFDDLTIGSSGGDASVDYDGGEIILANLGSSLLSEADFLFV